jgi:hypothetical protein
LRALNTPGNSKVQVRHLMGAVTMPNTVQQIAARLNMSYDEFIGEMRKRGCSEPTAVKIWNGYYENYEAFSDNDINLSNLRKAGDVLKVKTGSLISR